MKTLERPIAAGIRPQVTEVRGTEPWYQAYTALYVGYAALPIIAGLDKFTNYLVDWSQYLAPFMAGLVGGQGEVFMKGVGLLEIGAGVLVAVAPRVGALVVALWLAAIMGNLLMIPGYYDVALRDFGLAIGAFALWRLSGQPYRKH